MDRVEVQSADQHQGRINVGGPALRAVHPPRQVRFDGGVQVPFGQCDRSAAKNVFRSLVSSARSDPARKT
ncbi:hypothetical protein [Kribbella sp. CA-294648]|uniref:hypothetical protein n=1 Tax=Kribbella sp. CA-294648 TaxID=3239948 RepID=UPI003D921D1A